MNFWKEKNFLIPALCFIFLIIVRIPSFSVPDMNSDEGFYLSMGHQLSEGRLLYQEVWDNKPPLLYLIFAINSFIFGNTIFPLRVLNLFISAVTIFLTYLLGVKVFKLSRLGGSVLMIVSTLLHSFYFEMTLINAENIFVPLVLGGFLLGYLELENISKGGQYKVNRLLLSGLLFAFASWTKLVVIPEIGMIVLGSIIALFSPQIKDLGLAKSIQLAIKPAVLFALPGAILWGLTGLFFALNGAFGRFFEGVLGFGASYVSYDQTPAIFGIELAFLSPLYLSVLLGIIALIAGFVLLTRKITIPFGKQLVLLEIWLWGATIAIFLSSRGFPHYFQQMLPVLSIIIIYVGMYLAQVKNWKRSVSVGVGSIVSLLVLLAVFTNGSGSINWFTFNTYYSGYLDYTVGDAEYEDVLARYDEKSYATKIRLSRFIDDTRSSDVIYLVDNRPEIYGLTNTVSGYYQFAAYHIDADAQIDELFDELIDNNTTDVYILEGEYLGSLLEVKLTQIGAGIVNTITIGENTYAHIPIK